MLLTALATAALGSYTLKTALGIVRDQDVRDALRRLKTGAAQTVSVVHNSFSDAAARVQENRKIAGFARQNGLLVSRVFESATEEERQTLLAILNKYAGG